MKTQEQVWAALIEANPVPDVDIFGRENMDDATHLATLQQRSSEMTQLTTKQEEAKQRNRTWAWLAAAVLVILVGVAVFLLNQDAEEAPVATDPVPTTSVEPVPTTTPDVAPTTQPAPTTVDPAEAEWEAIPLPIFGIDDGGEYRTGAFYVPAAYTISGDAWERLIETPEFVYLCKEPDDVGNCQAAIFFFDPLASDVGQAIDSLTSRPGPTFSEPEPADIGGAAGFAFDVTGEGPHILHELSNGLDQIALHQGEQAKGYVVDVADTPVGVYVFSTGNGAYFDEVQTIIETVVWKDLS